MQTPANPRRRYALLTILSAAVLLACFLVGMHAPGLRPLLSILIPIAAGTLAGGIMLWWAPGLLDTYPRNKLWRILLESVPPICLYMLAIFQWPDVVAGMAPGGTRIAAALLPAALVLWTVVAFARYVRILDELQQRLELVSVALAAALASTLSAAIGFLHMGGVLTIPAEAWLWVFPMLAVAYSLMRAGLTRRYQ